MTRKIRIAAYISQYRSMGGSYQYAELILSALKRLDPNRYELRLWCENPLSKELGEKFAIQTSCVQESSQRRLMRRCLKLLNRLLHNPSIHAWVTAHPLSAYVARWHPDACISLEQAYTNIHNCAVIGPIHDLMHRYEATFPEVGDKDIYYGRELMYEGHCASASAILVDSELGKQHVLEVYAPAEQNVYVLPYVSADLGTTEIRPANFPLAEGQPFIMYPAQLWRHKNHVNLLKAIALLSRDSDIQCILTGGTDKNGFDNYVKTLDELDLHSHVHHIGYVNDSEMLWLYRHSRGLIMPSFFGPTNIPPLEAMRYGCPAAVSDIYAMRERYGDAVLYFNPHRPEEIAGCIQCLCTDDALCASLVEKGRKQAATWTNDDFKNRFLEILDDALAKMPRSKTQPQGKRQNKPLLAGSSFFRHRQRPHD